MRPSHPSSSTSMHGPASPLLGLFGIGASSRLAPSHHTGPTFVQVQSTPLQSGTPVLSELAKLALDRGDKVIVVAENAQRWSSLLSQQHRDGGVQVVPAFEHSCQAEFDDDFTGLGAGASWWEQVPHEVALHRAARGVTLIVESLDTLLDTAEPQSSSQDTARTVYRRLLPIVAGLDGRSRFVFGTTVAAHSLQSDLQSRLVSHLSSRASHGAGSGSSTNEDAASPSSSSSPYLTLSLQPPATWRYLLSEYGTGLRPASTTSSIASKLRDASNERTGSAPTAGIPPLRVRRTAAGSGSDDAQDSSLGVLFDWDAPPWRTTDPRLWSILATVNTQSSTAAAHGHTWWNVEVDRLKGEEIEAVQPADAPLAASSSSSSTFDAISSRITLADLLGPVSASESTRQHNHDERTVSHRARTGWGILTCEYRLNQAGSASASAKYGEEVVGCVFDGSSGSSEARLRLVPLEMGDYRAVAASASRGDDKKQTNKASQHDHHLPFNLELTAEQRARRDNVELPFAPTERIYEGISKEEPDALQGQLRRGTTGQSTIYFEPDSADEEDEEDPDEDLDI